MDKLTKTYLVLLSAFGVVLVFGTVKSTFYPDESIYVPGKPVVLYDSMTGDFIDGDVYSSAFRFEVDPNYVKANLFNNEVVTSDVDTPDCN